MLLLILEMNADALQKAIAATKKQMSAAAKKLDFIEAAQLRDEMFRLQELLASKKR